jgi:hypothetical protein
MAEPTRPEVVGKWWIPGMWMGGGDEIRIGRSAVGRARLMLMLPKSESHVLKRAPHLGCTN